MILKMQLPGQGFSKYYIILFLCSFQTCLAQFGQQEWTDIDRNYVLTNNIESIKITVAVSNGNFSKPVYFVYNQYDKYGRLSSQLVDGTDSLYQLRFSFRYDSTNLLSYEALKYGNKPLQERFFEKAFYPNIVKLRCENAKYTKYYIVDSAHRIEEVLNVIDPKATSLGGIEVNDWDRDKNDKYVKIYLLDSLLNKKRLIDEYWNFTYKLDTINGNLKFSFNVDSSITDAKLVYDTKAGNYSYSIAGHAFMFDKKHRIIKEQKHEDTIIYEYDSIKSDLIKKEDIYTNGKLTREIKYSYSFF
jgi:hypothetical protein